MILSVEGEEATGKTTFAYTAPAPIVGFAFDLGIERALYGAKFPELFAGKKIEIVPYPGPDSKALEKLLQQPPWKDLDITIFELPRALQLDSKRVVGCRELWNYFIALLGKALVDSAIRSIAIDTMTLARRIRADAHLQDLQAQAGPGGRGRIQLLQKEYGIPHDAIRSIYNGSKSLRKNLVAAHHLTDEYVADNPTGRRILEGWAGTYSQVDVALRLTKLKASPPEIRGSFQKFGYSLDTEGLTLSNPTWDKVARLVSAASEGRIQP